LPFFLLFLSFFFFFGVRDGLWTLIQFIKILIKLLRILFFWNFF
jgi:hypothetical protein